MRFGPLAAFVLGLAACGPRTRIADSDFVPLRVPDLGAVVARVGDVPIYGHQVRAEAQRSGKSLRDALADLVSDQLLAEHARRDGWRTVGPSDPDVKSALVQRLIERELEPRLRAEAVPDSVLRGLYERAEDSFVHPRLVEVGVLAIYTGERMSDDLRRTRAEAATELAAYVSEHPPKTLDDFIAIAQDSAWSSRAVVYRRLLQSSDKPLSPTIGREIVKLRSAGAMTGLLSDQDGFFIARYIDERPAENIPFEQVRERLRAGYLERWQRQQFDEFTGNLVQKHKVEAFFDRIPMNEQGP